MADTLALLGLLLSLLRELLQQLLMLRPARRKRVLLRRLESERLGDVLEQRVHAPVDRRRGVDERL